MNHCLDAIKQLRSEYSMMRRYLCTLAQSMTTLGMNNTDVIWANIEAMDDAVENMDNAVGKDLSDMVKASQEASRNVFKAALAGTAIASNDPEYVESVSELFDRTEESDDKD